MLQPDIKKEQVFVFALISLFPIYKETIPLIVET
jgi:hypothetical protein